MVKVPLRFKRRRRALARSLRDAVSQTLWDIWAKKRKYGQAFDTKAIIAPFLRAIPDLERHDAVVVAGQTSEGHDWIECGGFYCGTFRASWLGIPATGHLGHMRFHEFHRVVDGKIVEMQALLDIPQVMVQAGAWLMVPPLGSICG